VSWLLVLFQVGLVDASEHRSLAGDAGVRGVPWFKIYFNGEGLHVISNGESAMYIFVFILLIARAGVDYEGPRDSVGLVAAVRTEAKDRGVEVAAPAKPRCGAMEAAQDRAGNGGHSGACTGKGLVSFGLCKQKLSDSKECSALTYKKGTCYLHDRSLQDHWTDKEEGGMYVVKFTKGLDRCI
jgi:hypothetical protein